MFIKNFFSFERIWQWFVLLISISVGALVSCKPNRADRKIERSFYYWKSVFDLNEFEKQKLDTLQVSTIYLKFFDVDWDEAGKKPIPIAKLSMNENALASMRAPGSNNLRLNIIPVVFITNACIQQIEPHQIAELGDKISELVFNMIASNAFNDIPEIQFDCDWTASTKDKYFALLNEFRKQFTQMPISATIRLHQVKYVSKSGIPPVNRGLLMCYNMGNLKNPATKNSILETEELKKYTGSLQDYPLPLDIALPLFDWKVLYRNNRYAGLIQGLPETAFSGSFSTQKENRYLLTKDTLLMGYDLRKGDMIRNEQIRVKDVLASARVIGSRLKNTSLRVSLYHLDSVILNKYPTHDLENIYRSLH